MEPERKIEKLLRAFAKKRREQAGDAAELRAAARERLHREISRRSTGKSGGGFFASFFAGYRPRLAFAFCLIAIVAVGGSLLLPVFTARKADTLGTLASVDRKPANTPLAEQSEPMAAPPAVMAPAPVSRDEVANEKQTALTWSAAPRQSFGAIVSTNETPTLADGLENGVAQTNSFGGISAASAPPFSQEMLAYQTNQVPADLFANAGALDKNSADRAEISSAPQLVTNSTIGTLTLASAEPVAQKKLGVERTAPGSPAGGVVFDVVKSEDAKGTVFASRNFYREEIASRRSAKEASSSIPAAVLTSFRVEQNGGEMRIVDADGSVYTGMVQVATAKAAPAASFSARLQNAPAAAPKAPAAKTGPQMPAIQNYFFRVAGTNRNLRQNVVFSGNLIPLTNAGSAGRGRDMAESPAPLLLLNSRISGKAVIGNQKEIEVEARPAP